MKIALIVAAAILATFATLAGCGTAPATATPAADRPPVISALAKALRCTRFGPNDQAGAFTRQEGACTLPSGAHVVVATFSDEQSAIAWEDSVQEQGGYIAGGHLWAASARAQSVMTLTDSRLHRF